MRPPTGEPDAGDPPVRFGGRGEVQTLVPTPIRKAVEGYRSPRRFALVRELRGQISLNEWLCGLCTPFDSEILVLEFPPVSRLH